jgi:hypothetical protein
MADDKDKQKLIESLNAKFRSDKGFGKEKFLKILDLLQQDRHGNQKPFTDDQMTSIAKLATVKQRLGEAAVEKVIKALTDDKLAKMFQLNKKQLAQFVLSLSSKQIHALAEFLVPFLNAYSDTFIASLSSSQICCVWDILWPFYLENVEKNNLHANLLASLGYGRPELSSALEFAED